MAIDTRTVQQLLNNAGADPKLVVDGFMGPKTIAAIKAAQVRAGLTQTGIADAALIAVLERQAKASPPIPPSTAPSPAMPPIAFVQARNYTPTTGRTVDWVVIHTMEAGERPNTAEAVAAWFGGAAAPQASAHYCIDRDDIVQCVREQDVAWGAPGANHNGIHLEHAGFAKQTAVDWADEYSAAMLRLSAKLTAQICARYGIPVVALGPEQLAASDRGITTHAAVSQAFKRSNHTDPGASFPMTHYLELVRAAAQDSPDQMA